MSVKLAPEDELRLNVLLAGDLQAVRIDEGAGVLYGLTPRGEARITLNPVGRVEPYLMRVREVLGGHALDSPGGYPVHLRRWTRMGQYSSAKLEVLLTLGEPEAVTAVAHSPDLTDELARRTWWALPTMETARVMLVHDAVRQGAMGRVLAQHLIDHLPFEENPVDAVDTVRAVLASRLLEPDAIEQLWRKAHRRPHYLIGFLECLPDALPIQTGLSVGFPRIRGATPAARLLQRCFSPTGQAYLGAASLVLEKPLTHEVVYRLLDLLGAYFRDAATHDDLIELRDWPQACAAMVALSALNARLADPILSRTTAVGPQMRRHLEPLFGPILIHLNALKVRE